MRSFNNLHGYQKKAVEFILTRPSAGLFIGLGLGKTVITLTALEIFLRTKKAKKVLIVAPLQVCQTVWLQEAKSWRHTENLTFSFLLGHEKRRIAALNEKTQIHVLNRENIDWIVSHFIETKRPWLYDTIVIDESSSFKNSKTKRFKAFKKILKINPRVISLTGTPSPNGLTDLWSQIYLLDKGQRLGPSYYWYLNNYFTSDYRKFNWFLREGSKEKIYQKLTDIVLTLKADDYADLPGKRVIDQIVELPKSVFKKYQEIEKNFLAEFENRKIEVLNAAALANKLLQLANGAIYDENGFFIETHQEKIKVLKDLVENNPNENFLVAYNFKSDLVRLKKHFPEAVVLKENPRAVELWNQRKIKILLAHPASAGHGLNLQKGGSAIIWFGLNWSLELTEQFNGRIYRQGQTEKVKIIRLVTKGCIDERIVNAIEKKGLVQEALIDSLKI